MAASTFEIILTGRFELDDLTTIWRPDARRRPDPAVDALIEAEWSRRTANPAADRLLFPGPLCRLVDWAVSGGRLRLTLGPTDYREFLGTNIAGIAAIQARHPTHWRTFLANPLGVCTTLVSADAWLLVLRRSRAVAEYPGWLSVVGGHPTPSHDDGVGGVSPFLALQEEIVEEAGIQPGELTSVTCLGLIRNRTTATPDLVFAARPALTRAALETRLAAQPNRQEVGGWHWLNDDPAAIAAFLTRHPGQVTPAAAACLTVYAHTRQP